jgi:transcriptional regulator with XRE-family HTH domain
MDQKKIGDFISARRHALGLTQAQLGETLGVTDKSVSKWERGVCLPDASLYLPLCETLGITPNELFAGEAIAPEESAQRAEETLVTMARDGEEKRRRAQRILVVSLVIYSLLAGLLVFALSVLYERGEGRTNYIRPYDMSAEERTVAHLVSDTDNTLVYEFSAAAEFREVLLTETVIGSGGEVLTKQSVPLNTELKGSGTHTGLLAISFSGEGPDGPTYRVSLAQEHSVSSVSETALPTASPDYEYGVSRLRRTVTIKDETPIPFAALAVGDDLFLPYLNTKDAPEKIAEHSDACVIFEISFQ